MKQLHSLFIEDEDYKILVRAKGKKSWRAWIIEKAKEDVKKQELVI